METTKSRNSAAHPLKRQYEFDPQLPGTAQYAPSLYELMELARLWLNHILQTDYWCWLSHQSGSIELRIFENATSRLVKLRDILGLEILESLQVEVDAAFRAQVGERNWQAYIEDSDH